jgi:hypothetical protein
LFTLTNLIRSNRYSTVPPQATDSSSEAATKPAAAAASALPQDQTNPHVNQAEDALNEEEFTVLTRRKIKENQKQQEMETMKSHPFYIGKAVKM